MSSRDPDGHFKATFGIIPGKLDENVEGVTVTRLDSIGID